MDCEAFEALAIDLLYGELSPAGGAGGPEAPRAAAIRAEASAHAASCAECGKLSKELDEARKSAAALPARIPPPAAVDERILLAARAAADVRQHPLRGSGLHVAAAAVIACLLVGVSFAVGTRIGAQHGKPENSEGPIIIEPARNPDGLLTGIEASPPSKPNVSRAEYRKYMDEMLKLANEDLAKGDAKRALMEFGGVYSSGGRSIMALEARVGMAKCYEALGDFEKALDAARDARTKNQDWGTNVDAIEDAAAKLVVELQSKKPR